MTHTYRCVAKAGVAGRHVNPAAAALLAERPAVRVEYDEAIVAEHNEARNELIVWNFRGRTPHEEAKEFSHRHRMSLARDNSTDTKLTAACARVEADDPIAKGISGGQHDDRRLNATAAQLGEHLKPVTTWERQVQQHRIERVVVRDEARKRPLAGAFDHHAVPLPLESFAKGASHLLLVLDHEQMPTRLRARRRKGCGHIPKLIEYLVARARSGTRLQTNFRPSHCEGQYHGP